MKLKSTLWALAFACIAMSCSDDELTGSGSENEGGGGSATTAQMKVIISAGTGTSTKASADPEQGDDNELGSYDEYQVKDIAVFLYKGAEKPTSGPLSLDGSKEIVAMGYTADTNEQQTTNPTNHEWEATIKVQVSDKDMKTFAGQKFGVIALTNITEDSYGAIKEVLSTQPTNTVQDLADYLQTGIHTKDGFVMSTHMMDDTGYGTGSGPKYSIVEFPQNPSSSTAIPTVECYVERLAAKVRINQPKSGNGTVETDGYKYQIGSTGDCVTLTAAAVINQLTSGEYLLKRVSEERTADWNLSGDCKLLGDEVYDAVNSKYNFVVDPWTTKKESSSIMEDDKLKIEMDNDKTVSFNLQTSNIKLGYNNHIAMTDGSSNTLNYGVFWQTIAGYSGTDWSTEQLKPKNLTGTDPITLAYTMENTVNVANSLNALMTGVMFKAKYEPEKVSDINPTDYASIKDDATLPSDGTFYTYGNIKFASLEAIFAYELALNATGQSSSNMLYWKDFMSETGGQWSNLTVAQFKSYIATFGSTTYLDSFEYLAYLKQQVNDQADVTNVKDIANIQTFENYIAAKYTGASANKTLPTKVKKYEGGTCYYFYWIRHEDNGDPLTVGPMEYAIVRNNIYDLTVSGISGLGEAAIDVPDPSEPAETKTATIQVTLKVRNWVVRKNNVIIL